MTLSQFVIVLYKVSEEGKLKTIKVFKELTGLGLRNSKDVIDTFCEYSPSNKLGVDMEGIFKNLRSQNKKVWDDIKSHIRKLKYEEFIKVNNLRL